MLFLSHLGVYIKPLLVRAVVQIIPNRGHWKVGRVASPALHGADADVTAHVSFQLVECVDVLLSIIWEQTTSCIFVQNKERVGRGSAVELSSTHRALVNSQHTHGKGCIVIHVAHLSGIIHYHSKIRRRCERKKNTKTGGTKTGPSLSLSCVHVRFTGICATCHSPKSMRKTSTATEVSTGVSRL